MTEKQFNALQFIVSLVQWVYKFREESTLEKDSFLETHAERLVRAHISSLRHFSIQSLNSKISTLLSRT
jgi:hypothetical protein